MYELEYLLRRAEVKQRQDIILGKYHYILNNAGMLLEQNIDYLADKKDAQMKLRNPKQFYDFIWELEVRTMLSQLGANAFFVDPKNGNTYDGVFEIEGYSIPYECKNKNLDNEQYNTNSMFAQILANKLGDIQSVRNKIIQIEFDYGRFEDINTIVAIIRDKFDVWDYQSILGRYKVRSLKRVPFNTPPQILLRRDGVTQVFEICQKDRSKLYSDDISDKVILTKLLIKIPDETQELSNLNSVLKKANKQLPPGGVVFLHVPYSTFDSAKGEVTKELSQSFSNISAVKIVSIDVAFKENQGVKVSRFEDLIVSPRAQKTLFPCIKEFLDQPMVFIKYSFMQE